MVAIEESEGEDRRRDRGLSPACGRRSPYALSLRLRLALVITAAIVIAVLVLSSGTYSLVKRDQEQKALEAAVAQARFNLLFARSTLPPDPGSSAYGALLDALAVRGDFGTLVDTHVETYLSGSEANPALISSELAQKVEQGRLAYQVVPTPNGSVLALGAELRPGGAALYFLFPRYEQEASLARLRNASILLGALLALMGTGLGWVLAGRALAPVGRVSAAANRMARGDLSTRLPEDHDDFGRLSSSFNHMAESLQAKMQAMADARAREQRFVADVAHELRTPLGALVGEIALIEGFLDRYAPGTDFQKARRAAELAAMDGDRLCTLVEDLLEISRLDAGAAACQWEEVPIAAFLENVLRSQHQMDRAGVRMRLPSEGDTAVLTDPRRLERILVNLLDNADRHGAPPVVLRASLVPAPVPALLVLTVADRGPGISAEHLPHVFERFYKADPSRGRTRGSGLGLAIASENARLLGGSLLAHSRPGRGARFILRLPLSHERECLGWEDGPPSLS